MGVSLAELRRRSKPYDPEKVAKESISAEECDRLVEAYQARHQHEKKPPLDTIDVIEDDVVDSQGQDLIESVDLLDKTYDLLVSILNHKSIRLPKEIKFRLSELCDEVGSFTEDMTGLTANLPGVH